MNDAQTTATGFLQHKPVYSIELTRQEYYLIRRLRQLRNEGKRFMLVELGRVIKWREVGRAES